MSRGPHRGTIARLQIGHKVLTDDTDRDVVLFVTSDPVIESTAVVELLASDGPVLWRDRLQLD